MTGRNDIWGIIIIIVVWIIQMWITCIAANRMEGLGRFSDPLGIAAYNKNGIVQEIASIFPLCLFTPENITPHILPINIQTTRCQIDHV